MAQTAERRCLAGLPLQWHAGKGSKPGQAFAACMTHLQRSHAAHRSQWLDMDARQTGTHVHKVLPPHNS